jgi:uncharacterized membrane protein YfcA
MSTATILALMAVGFFTGGFGAVAGIGGGVIITPLLMMYFGLPMQQAIGVTLVAVIATSTATSSLFVERHVTDIRLGMTLEIATTVGAMIAALLAPHVDRRTLAVLFTVFLLYTAFSLVKKAWDTRKQKKHDEVADYTVHNYPIGLGASLIAGGMSGLLGIGGGPIKVPVMLLFMKVPLRVAAATSNFMIGVTAATSALIYWGRGDVNISVATPLVAGVFAGSLLGARLAPKVRPVYVLGLLIVLLSWLGIQMLARLLSGGIH